MKLSVTISLKDALSKQADRVLTGMTNAAIKASTGISKANDKANASQMRMFQDRERLGVRSEQRIQREINVTEASYRRLMQSGTMSWREQVRATEAMRSKVQQLNNEMGKLTKMQRLAAGWRFAASTLAGGIAARMVVKPAVDKAMAYDLRLANMSNTAFAGQPIASRRAGMRYLDQSIVNAVRTGGGSRDTAAEALDALIASGAMSSGDAGHMLPTLMKAATASNASAVDLSGIAIRGMQTFKIKASDLPRIIDMAVAAGQAGGFELKDMARWLPQQMAAATQSGLSGTAGFAKLVSMNQAAAITAGTKDEAGNNLVNLLAKINSPDTAQDAKKLGINLPKYLAQQRSKGIDSIDAFVGLADKQVSKNSAWKQLQKQLAAAKDDASKRETLDSMASIVQGSGVGKLVQDRQALMALVGIMNNRSYLDSVQKSVQASSGATNSNFALISETASFKTGQAGNEKEIAQQMAMDGLTPSIGALSDKVVEAARTYPGFTAATVAATTALAALAAAGAGAAVTGVLTGGAGKAGAVKGAVKLALGGAGGLAAGALPWLGVGGASLGGGMLAGNSTVGIANWGLSKFTGRDNALGEFLLNLTRKGDGIQLNGDIKIKVDQNGKVIGATFESNQPRLRSNVYAGQSMAGGN